MKTKRNLFLFFLFAIASLIVIPYGCKKNDDTQGPTPVKKKYVWVVGAVDSTSYGKILFSSDGGDTWLRQGEGSAALQGTLLFDVWAVDTNDVWAVGINSSIIKTNDGGNRWVRITSPEIPPAIVFQSISMVGNNDIWICGESGTVINSSNGGNTWTIFDPNFFHNGLMQGIYAIDAQTVYVVGGYRISNGAKGFIAHTADGGQTWDSIIPENNYNRNEWLGVKATDKNHIVVYGKSAHYVVSNDAGATWKNDSVPDTGGGGIGGADMNCLAMIDAQTWWGAFDYDVIFITTDGGTWTKQTSAGPGAMWLYGIDYYDRNLAVIVALSSVLPTGKIIKTSNGGDVWELKYNSRSALFKISFIKN